MINKVPLAQLGIVSATDLCALNRGDPPLSFPRDLDLRSHTEPTNKPAEAKNLYKATYWGPGLAP